MRVRATALSLIPSSLSVACEGLDSRITPCLEVTYATTPVPPKYPAVDEVSTTEPRDQSDDSGFVRMWKNASLRAVN